MAVFLKCVISADTKNLFDMYLFLWNSNAKRPFLFFWLFSRMCFCDTDVSIITPLLITMVPLKGNYVKYFEEAWGHVQHCASLSARLHLYPLPCKARFLYNLLPLRTRFQMYLHTSHKNETLYWALNAQMNKHVNTPGPCLSDMQKFGGIQWISHIALGQSIKLK